MIFRRAHPPDADDLLPEAIFARPIFYFTWAYFEGADDLDLFVEASFCINNDTHFVLRHYKGHPPKTVTLYVDVALQEFTDTASLCESVAREFGLPASAVAWKRGDPVTFGSLRLTRDRLREAEARILALKIAATQPEGFATTSYIKAHVPDYVHLGAEDLVASPSRPGEKKWQQVVGNVISHQSARTSIFGRGLARKVPHGIQITPAGREYLHSIGFSEKRAL